MVVNLNPHIEQVELIGKCENIFMENLTSMSNCNGNMTLAASVAVKFQEKYLKIIVKEWATMFMYCRKAGNLKLGQVPGILIFLTGTVLRYRRYGGLQT